MKVVWMIKHFWPDAHYQKLLEAHSDQLFIHRSENMFQDIDLTGTFEFKSSSE